MDLAYVAHTRWTHDMVSTPVLTSHVAVRNDIINIRARFADQFMGIDPNQQPLTVMPDLPLSMTRPEEDFVDLTEVRPRVPRQRTTSHDHAKIARSRGWYTLRLQALAYEPPKDELDEARQFRTVSLSTQLRIAFARRRVGRGGRVWIDRSSVHMPRLLEAAELNGTAVVPGPELVRGHHTVNVLHSASYPHGAWLAGLGCHRGGVTRTRTGTLGRTLPRTTRT